MSDWFGRMFISGADFPREYDGDDPASILRRASDDGNYSADADKVSVEIVKWTGSEWTPWRHDGHLLEVAWSEKWDGLYHRVHCPQMAGRVCPMEPKGCVLQEELASAGLEFFTSGLGIPDETTFALPLALEYRMRGSHGEDDDEFLEIRPANWSS